MKDVEEIHTHHIMEQDWQDISSEPLVVGEKRISTHADGGPRYQVCTH